MPDAPPTASPTLAPTFVDGVLIVLGFAASSYFATLIPIEIKNDAQTSVYFRAWLALPAGVILLWPIFYRTQLLRGRTERLTHVEMILAASWLLHLVWVSAVLLLPHPESGTAVLTISIVRSFLTLHALIGVAAIGLGIVKVFSPGAVPWTHAFGTVLLGWYLVPIALYAFGIVAAD